LQQEILLATINAMGAIFYVIDVKTQEVLFANEACKKTFGDVVGKKCFSAIQGLSESCSFCVIPKMNTEEISSAVTCEYKNNLNGKFYESHDTVIKWVDGRVVKAQVAFDVTDKKVAEEKLRKSEARFRLLFEEHKAMMYIVDPQDGVLLDVNNAAAEFYGYDRDELCGKHISIIHTFTKEQIDEARQKAAVTPQTIFTVNHRLRNGEIRSMEIYTSPIEVDGKKALFSILHDVTERKKAEDALKKLNETLEHRVTEESAKRVEQERVMMQQSRMAAMGEMIGAIAHQWRQPLNALGIMVQDTLVAQRYDEMNEVYLEDFVQKSMSQIQFMSSTIDDFRSFFRQDKSKKEFVLNGKVKEVVQMLSAQFAINSISSIIEEECELSFNGFENEFKQVVLNLLTNAKDQLSDTKIKNPEIRIKIFKNGGASVISIEDNGGGIDKECIEKIFDPYFTTKTPDKGTGIGLYMAKTIIESHMGGILSAQNTNSGAEFRIELGSA